MKRLHFNKVNNLSQLHNELLVALPGLRRVGMGDDGRNRALPDNIVVHGLGNDIWFTVVDDADEAAIQAVVDAHTPA